VLGRLYFTERLDASDWRYGTNWARCSPLRPSSFDSVGISNGGVQIGRGEGDRRKSEDQPHAKAAARESHLEFSCFLQGLS
jgi:hypothetical protein